MRYMTILLHKSDNLYYQSTNDYKDAEEALARARVTHAANTWIVVGTIEEREAHKLGLAANTQRPRWDIWVESIKDKLYTGKLDPADFMGMPTPITPGPRKPQPVICPEVWATPRKDVDYMSAVRDMCRPTRN